MPEILDEIYTPPDEMSRAKWTSAKREQYFKDHPENFADPESQGYPIEDGSDVDDAYRLAGHADNPDAVRAKIKSIAKRLGLEASLPDTAKEDDTPTKERAMSGNDAPVTDKDPHDNDADQTLEAQDIRIELNGKPLERAFDAPAAETPTEETSQVVTPETFAVYAPIVRMDALKREVTGQATAEVPDAYGTIFGYYPEAWKKWRGNIREQHDPKKAVGKALEILPDEERRAIDVDLKVSRGAQDTWLKVEDGVLSGLSASIIPDAEFGNDPRRWPRKEYNGKQYPYLPRYTVAELSLVDNPACPGCDIQIVRADGFATEVLDFTEEEIPVPTEPEQKQERAGARVSADTQGKMHDSIKHTLHAAQSQMANCGCDNCMAAQKLIDPDGDGDIDMGGYDDPDGDSEQLYNRQQPQGLNLEEYATKIQEQIDRALQPVYTRLQGIAGTLARSNAAPSIAPLESMITSAISRAVESLDAKFAELPTRASLDEVRTELLVVKGQVERIADTPVPGAPISNANAIEKRLPTDPRAMNAPQQADYPQLYDAFAQLSNAGAFPDINSQINAAAAVLQRQPRRS